MLFSRRYGKEAYYYIERVCGQWFIFRMPYRRAIPECMFGNRHDTFIDAHRALIQLDV